MPIVSSLHLYPLKSGRVVDVDSFSFDPSGPIGDRRWMIVSNDSAGSFIRQRTRCVITTLDPQTGERDGKEPLQTLTQYRKTDQVVIFGQNYTNVSKVGKIEVGMEIELL